MRVTVSSLLSVVTVGAGVTGALDIGRRQPQPRVYDLYPRFQNSSISITTTSDSTVQPTTNSGSYGGIPVTNVDNVTAPITNPKHSQGKPTLVYISSPAKSPIAPASGSKSTSKIDSVSSSSSSTTNTPSTKYSSEGPSHTPNVYSPDTVSTGLQHIPTFIPPKPTGFSFFHNTTTTAKPTCLQTPGTVTYTAIGYATTSTVKVTKTVYLGGWDGEFPSKQESGYHTPRPTTSTEAQPTNSPGESPYPIANESYRLPVASEASTHESAYTTRQSYSLPLESGAPESEPGYTSLQPTPPPPDASTGEYYALPVSDSPGDEAVLGDESAPAGEATGDYDTPAAVDEAEPSKSHGVAYFLEQLFRRELQTAQITAAPVSVTHQFQKREVVDVTQVWTGAGPPPIDEYHTYDPAIPSSAWGPGPPVTLTAGSTTGIYQLPAPPTDMGRLPVETGGCVLPDVATTTIKGTETSYMTITYTVTAYGFPKTEAPFGSSVPKTTYAYDQIPIDIEDKPSTRIIYIPAPTPPPSLLPEGVSPSGVNLVSDNPGSGPGSQPPSINSPEQPGYGSDNPKPEGPNPEGPNPESTNPGGTKPEGTKPEGTKPEGTKPEGTKPDAPSDSSGANQDIDDDGAPDWKDGDLDGDDINKNDPGSVPMPAPGESGQSNPGKPFDTQGNTGQNTETPSGGNDPNASVDTPHSITSADFDGDGIDNTHDAGVDSDGISDLTDLDGDSVANKGDDDVDGDGKLNAVDAGTDADRIGNAFDTDLGGDRVANANDDDIDTDGVKNGGDDDIDGDGVENDDDADAGGDGLDGEVRTTVIAVEGKEDEEPKDEEEEDEDDAAVGSFGGISLVAVMGSVGSGLIVFF